MRFRKSFERTQVDGETRITELDHAGANKVKVEDFILPALIKLRAQVEGYG